MMTSINPKNVSLTNMQPNEGRGNMPSTTNNLFQRYNIGIEKEGMNDGGIGNNIKFQTNANANFNMNDNNNFNNFNQQQQQFNTYKNLNEQAKINDNNVNMMMKNNGFNKLNNDYTKINDNNNITNNLNNLNLKYNNQNNSVNLNLGIQAKKNYSTPILNEPGPSSNQDANYNRSFDMYERNQPMKNVLNYGQPQNLNQNKNAGNNEYYLAEIEKLKKEINNLKKNNEYLNIQLKEEQKKSQQLFSVQKAKDEGENSILAEISHCLQVSSFEEILPKLNEIINYLNNNVSNNVKDKKKENDNKIRDELISKLQNLYLSLTGSNEKKEEITIKILWRWIKHLINTVKQLALEKERNIEMYQNMQEIGECKDYVEELLSMFNLQSLEELKMFINNLLKQNDININKSNENENENENENDNNQELSNIQMGRQPQIIQQQFQVQNYQQEEENDDGEGEGEAEGEGEGEMEGDGEGEGEEDAGEMEGEEGVEMEGEEEIEENIDPNQQQYENENEYDENNEMMQQQMEINNQNNPNEGNYNFKYDDGHVNP